MLLQIVIRWVKGFSKMYNLLLFAQLIKFFCTVFAKLLDFTINIWIFANFPSSLRTFQKCIKYYRFVSQEENRGEGSL